MPSILPELSFEEMLDLYKIYSVSGKLNGEQGYMTQPQYIQLVEMFNLYHELGGNGKIQEIFEKTTKSLEVRK